MRKLNAYLGYFMALIFAVHAAEESLVMQGVIPHNNEQKNGGICLMFLVAIHMLITLILVLQNRKANYLKPQIFEKNGETYIQRYTGIAVLAFSAIHATGNYWLNSAFATYALRPRPIWLFIAEALMVIAVVVHLNISLEKAAVTLGWVRGVKSKKVIKAVTAAFITLSGLFAIYGYVCYYILGAEVI